MEKTFREYRPEGGWIKQRKRERTIARVQAIAAAVVTFGVLALTSFMEAM